MNRALTAVLCLTTVCGLAVAQPATTPPSAPAAQPAALAKPDARAMAAKAIAYLKTKQDAATGGWAVNPKGPTFPAISGLVLTGMLMDKTVTEADPSVVNGVKFILSNVQADGGIYDKVLPSYNTSICLCALAKVNNPPTVKKVIKDAQEFLKSLQYGEGAIEHDGMADSAKKVDKEHAFYGGTGYGRGGRPDLSNTAWVLEGLHASGVDSNDPAFQRALAFLQRTQMIEAKDGVKINDMPYAKGSKQGGFIYATSSDKDHIGSGSSNAKTIEETMDDGSKVSTLRAYGSMTYSGFKSYLYAGLKKDDPRVAAAMDWISRNYTVTENPGVGPEGLYYYYIVFSRAMQANGQAMIRTIAADGSTAERNWAKDLVEQLATLQNPDGSFKATKDGARWMEDNPVLITAYALIALEEADKQLSK